MYASRPRCSAKLDAERVLRVSFTLGARGKRKRAGCRPDADQGGAGLFHVRGSGKVDEASSSTTSTARRRSTPWGCRSRRCRRRTWSSVRQHHEAFNGRPSRLGSILRRGGRLRQRAVARSPWTGTYGGDEGSEGLHRDLLAVVLRLLRVELEHEAHR